MELPIPQPPPGSLVRIEPFIGGVRCFLHTAPETQRRLVIRLLGAAATSLFMGYCVAQFASLSEDWLPHWHPLAFATVPMLIATIWIADQFRQRNQSPPAVLTLSADRFEFISHHARQGYSMVLESAATQLPLAFGGSGGPVVGWKSEVQRPELTQHRNTPLAPPDLWVKVGNRHVNLSGLLDGTERGWLKRVIENWLDGVGWFGPQG